MSKIYRIRNFSAAGLLAVPIILSGCSGFSKESMDVDPPPAQQEAQMLQTMNGLVAPDGATKTTAGSPTATVYLSNPNGLLAPVSLALPQSDDKNIGASLRVALESIVKDGLYKDLIPEGFTGVLPAGTEVKNVSVEKEKKLAIVEFSKPFVTYDAKNERAMLEAITWTLTGDASIEHVQIWVDGEKLTQMPINQTPLDHSLGREFGINLEKGEGASYLTSSPVVVYFSALSPTGIQYYVPITRLVESGENKLHTALGELIHGPGIRGSLEQVMTSGTSLESVKTAKDGTVTVALKDDMFAEGEQVPQEMLQSVVLTVAENAGNPKVKIQLNGTTPVIGLDQLNYSEPVSRPEYINEIPL
ncbi:germination protein M [Paenibacillus sp. DS2015]|uniref:GerMN domain-containing protein n=1 Tax=Paenibacillus sp. DS2015 TaxID=3373917 RepID=UPI003D1F4D8D